MNVIGGRPHKPGNVLPILFAGYSQRSTGSSRNAEVITTTAVRSSQSRSGPRDTSFMADDNRTLGSDFQKMASGHEDQLPEQHGVPAHIADYGAFG